MSCSFAADASPLAALLNESQSVNKSHQEVFYFIKYLANRVEELRACSVPPEDPLPLQASYNPRKIGRFLYFSESGCQVRSPRLFARDSATKGIYDEVPAGQACHKSYGRSHKNAPAYIMFFSCPVHGHCFGGHIIDGKEGRKDPSYALYTHLPKAPSILFYDFACSLEEFNLNRESGYG